MQHTFSPCILSSSSPHQFSSSLSVCVSLPFPSQTYSLKSEKKVTKSQLQDHRVPVNLVIAHFCQSNNQSINQSINQSKEIYKSLPFRRWCMGTNRRHVIDDTPPETGELSGVSWTYAVNFTDWNNFQVSGFRFISIPFVHVQCKGKLIGAVL